MLQLIMTMAMLPESEWTIWDASCYYIVNRIKPKKISALGENPDANDVLAILNDDLQTPKRQNIIDNCNARQYYLQRLCETVGLKAQIIDARPALTAEEFGSSMSEAMEYTERIRADSPELYSRIVRPDANPASRLYLPLEIAEAIYLDARGKFGPETEIWFDETILALMESKGLGYCAIRCPFPRQFKAPYLGNTGESVTTKDYPDTARRKLENQDYRRYIAWIIRPLRNFGENLEDTVIRLNNSIEGSN